jgi:putative ABC transport system permease protein
MLTSGWIAFRRSVRSLQRSPLETVLIVLVLGAGIGYSSALFAVISNVFLRPLPFPDSDRLVRVAGLVAPRGADRLEWWRGHCAGIVNLAQYSLRGANLGLGTRAERISVTEVSPDFFDAIGILPSSGRGFVFEDEEGDGRVAIISHSLWLEALGGGDTAGRQIELNGVRRMVVGIMPQGFGFPGQTRVWIPRAKTGGAPALDPGFDPALPAGLSESFVARLAPGKTVGQVQAELTSVVESLQKSGTRGGLVVVVPFRDALIGPVRTPVWGLFASSVFLLLVACASAGNLLLAHALARGQELAILHCLGARRIDVLLQPAADAILFTILGGSAGLMLASWSVKAIRAVAPATLPRLAEVTVDMRVAFFCFGVSLAVNAVTALGAARWAIAAHASPPRASGASGMDKSTRRTRWALVTGQVALTLVLLVSEVLSLRTLHRISNTDPGFDAGGLASVELGLGRAPRSIRELTTIQSAVLERLKPLRIPVGMVSAAPLSGVSGGYLYFAAQTGSSERMALNSLIAGDYFHAMGIPLLAGRDFRPSDSEDSRAVMIINDVMARLVWPGEHAVGKTMRIGGEFREVVGVVGSVRFIDLGEQPEPQCYFPFAQPYGRKAPPGSAMTMVFHGAPSGTTVWTRTLKRVVAEADPGVSLYSERTGADLLSFVKAPVVFRATLLGVSAVVAMLIGLAGVYGIVSYVVARRTPEFGVRLALGQPPRSVMTLVLAEGVRLGACGVAIGALLALAASKLISSLLFGVPEADPGTILAASGLLFAGVIAASLPPAVRALSIDVARALRWE